MCIVVCGSLFTFLKLLVLGTKSWKQHKDLPHYILLLAKIHCQDTDFYFLFAMVTSPCLAPLRRKVNDLEHQLLNVVSSSQGRFRQVSLGLYVELHSAKFWTVEDIYPVTSHCSTNSSSLAATAHCFRCQQVSELLSLEGEISMDSM